MEKTNLKEIAKTLGMSVSTVSKALNGYSDVSDKTKKIVLDLAEKLNYTPNSFAVNLRTKASKTIGVIIPTMVHYFFSNIIDSILKECEERGYMVIIMQSNENYELEKKQVDLLLSKGVDGILISLSNKTRDTTHLKKVIKSGVPLILFDKIEKNIKCSKIINDDRQAAYNAVSHLIKNGNKRIAHFRGALNPQNSIDRFLGYKKALTDNNIEYDPSLVYECKNNNRDDFVEGAEIAKQLILDHKDNVDAIFTVNDLISIGTLNYFNRNNIKVPDEIELFGFSNWFMTNVTTPSISSVEQNANKIGKKAAEVLFKELEQKANDEEIFYETHIIDTELIYRDSTSNTIR